MMAGWTMSLEGWIWMGAWALVLISLVWLLAREPRHPTHKDPGEILRMRFARGELTEAEFLRAAAALAAHRPARSTNGRANDAAGADPHPPEVRRD